MTIAKAANEEAKANTEASAAVQQEVVASLAKQAAEDAFDVARPSIPEAKKALTKVQAWTLEAQRSAAHAQQIADEAKHIVERAAEKAANAIQMQIRADAHAAAEKRASMAGESTEAREMTMLNAVAGAAEPYHLMMLRQQKLVEESYWKAKSAQKSATSLQEKAKELAGKAQELQAKGDTVYAQQLMSMAHGTMAAAQEMKGWALKLYNQANTVGGGVGYYELAMGQAAANVAMTKLINTPPALPPAPTLLEVSWERHGLKLSGFVVKHGEEEKTVN